MAKLVVNSESLVSVADAIRTKGNTTEELTFPQGFVDGINAIESGGGTEELQKQLDMYYSASVVLQLDNNSNNPMRNTWTYNTIPRIDFSKMTAMRYAFNSSSIEYIDYFINSEKVWSHSSAFTATKKFKWMVGIDLSSSTSIFELFAYSTIEVIQEPLNIPNVTDTRKAFDSCSALREIRFVTECIKVSTSFAHSAKLTAESKDSIFNGLATVETAQTLTLPANLKILQSQVDSANAKGWTVAGGTVVSEEEYYE